MKLTKYLLLATSLLTISVYGALSEVKEPLRLYALNCGTIDVSDMRDLSDNGQYDGESVSLVNPCFLIRHEKGDLIWDTGHIDSLAESSNGQISGVWHSKMQVKLEQQLAQLQLEPKDIEYLALSHIHPDHSGNANLFSHSTFLVNTQERAYMFSDKIKSYFGSYYAELESAKTITFENEYDVFGDDSVVITTLPGHTPGSSVLLVRLAETGNVLLTGDLYVHAKGRELNTMHRYNTDKAETLKSRAKFEALAKKENARIIIQHEKSDFESLPSFPSYLN
ncbi:N-acyl homoserine lactonase family protein [Thalassotalea fusca]